LASPRLAQTAGTEPNAARAMDRLLNRAALGERLTRRQVLLAAGIGLAGVACTRGSSGSASPAGPPGSIAALTHAVSQLSVLGTGSDAPPMNPGRNRLAFILANAHGQALVGGSPHVWLAPDQRSKAIAPFASTWHPFTAYQKTADRSPRSPLPGAFVAQVDIPRAGTWFVAVTVSEGSRRLAGSGIVQVSGGHVVGGLGTKAISTPTPQIKEICTRTPVDHMHYVSLDSALKNGKPTIVSFGTPLLCTSRLCGPVVDEQILAFEQIGKDRANFIHVEEFLPGPDLKPPPATPKNLSPAFKAWGLETDP
jgi:hypothetical protein